MKVVSRYCDSCGIKIPATDIKDGIALKYEESYYCKECKSEIIPLIEQKKGGKPAPAGPAAVKAAGIAPKPGAKPGAAPAKPGAAAAKPAGPAAGTSAKSNGNGSAPAVAPMRRGSAAPTVKPGGARPPIARKPIAKVPARPARDEDVDEEAGSEGELDAEEAPPAGFPVVPVAVGGVAVVAIAVALVFLLKGPSAPAKGAGDGGSSEAAAEKPNEQKNEELLARTAGEVEKLSGDLSASIQAYETARTRIVPAANGQKIADEMDARVEKLEEDLKNVAGKKFAEISEQATTERNAGRYEAALELFKKFPADYKDTDWAKVNVKSEIAKLETVLAAKREVEPILKKAEAYAREKEYRLAVGVLEGFDREFYRDAGDISEKLEKTIAEYQGLMNEGEQKQALAGLDKKEKADADAEAKAAAEKRKKEDERIAKLPWENLMGDDLLIWNLPKPVPPDAWKLEKSTRELTGKCGAAYKNNPFGAIIGVGKPGWKDYIVQFRYKIVKGGFHVGLRSSQQGSVDGLLPTSSDGQWHTVEVSIRGSGSDTELTITEGGASKPCPGKDLDASRAGGVAFVLDPQSECVFADLKVKVINKE